MPSPMPTRIAPVSFLRSVIGTKRVEPAGLLPLSSHHDLIEGSQVFKTRTSFQPCAVLCDVDFARILQARRQIKRFESHILRIHSRHKRYPTAVVTSSL